MYYGNERQAKVNLHWALVAKGWKTYGFRADESDSMTDYYSPASWDGIASKNGLVLVVDSYGNGDSGRKIYKREYTSNTRAIDEKMEKVNALYERGSTEGERESARIQLVKLESRKLAEAKQEELSQVLVEEYPIFSKHPTKRTKWHLEKDGVILASGCTLYSLYNLPDYYDLETLSINRKYHEKYSYYRKDDFNEIEYYTMKDEEEKAVKLLEKIINTVEKFAQDFDSIVVSDGTKEGEKAGLEQSEKGYKKVVKTKTVKKLQMVEIERTEPKEGDYITMPHHGHYWLITREYNRKGTWNGVTEERKCFTYEIVGAESRKYARKKNPKSYYQFAHNMKDIKIFELKEIEVTQTYDALEKVAPVRTESKKEIKPQAESKTQNKQELTEGCQVVFNQDKNGIELYFDGKPSDTMRENLKTNGFRWSKFQKMWYAKDTEENREFIKTIKSIDFETPQQAENKEVDETPQIYAEYEIKHNRNMNGIEIVFKTEPCNNQKNVLKSNQFRYLISKDMWYSRYSDEKMKLMIEILGGIENA